MGTILRAGVEIGMQWYLIHTKPRQEKLALQNLEQQGYCCYLPLFVAEKLQQGRLVAVEEPLFPRYLFIQLDTHASAKSWGPLRSTKGVSRLVAFGTDPAKIDSALVTRLQARESDLRAHPQKRFSQGDRVHLTFGAFAGLEAVYQTDDGERRAMVLIELLSQPVRVRVPAASLRAVG